MKRLFWNLVNVISFLIGSYLGFKLAKKRKWFETDMRFWPKWIYDPRSKVNG